MAQTIGLQEWLPKNGDYSLLPFKFHVLGETREVLVSEAGDFLVCARGTAERIVSRQVRSDESLFEELLARHFIALEPYPASLDVVAARIRARKGYLDSFTALHILVVTLRCNFSCHYCQVSRQTSDKSQFDMSR